MITGQVDLVGLRLVAGQCTHLRGLVLAEQLIRILGQVEELGLAHIVFGRFIFNELPVALPDGRGWTVVVGNARGMGEVAEDGETLAGGD